MKANFLRNCVILLTFAFFFYQCTDQHARYDDPPWLGGTNIETLEKAGNCTQFLALMDKAEFRTSLENQLFTLFVPNDSCFTAYFKSIGKNSVEDLTVEEAEVLFGQHILVNPRSRDQLIYEYSGSWGELESPEGEYGSLFHRKETYSVPLDYSEEVRYNSIYKGQTLLIYRQETLIPLFTTEYFQDYFGDPEGSDYLFMYPGSSWSGTQWHDAMVTEGEVRTSSGFIYYLDRVVAPIPTIEVYLKDHQDQYGLFFDLAQRFANYENPMFNEKKERIYRKNYKEILNFADERGTSTTHPGYMVNMFTAFVPKDDVLQAYLDNTVFKVNESIDSVPRQYLVYLLQSHLNSFLNLKSKMDKQFINYLGDEIDIDTDNDIASAMMCGNGVIYTMNRVLEPNAFSCVPGPMFYNNNYTTFLTALQKSKELVSVTQPDLDVTLFAPDNDLLLEYGIRASDDGTEVSIQIRNSDGIWKEMEPLDLQEFVQDYIHLGNYDDFNGEGYIRMKSDNYVYFNNGKIYGGGNQVAGDYCTVLEKNVSEKNGNLYYLNNSIKAAPNAAERMMADPDLTSFIALLDSAELIDSIQEVYEQTGIEYPQIRFMPDLDQWTVLAPTNQAIADAEAAGLIPTDINELKNFLFYHFIRNKSVFDDGVFSGIVSTQKTDTVIGSEIIYETVDFSNSVNSLKVKDNSGATITISHANANKLIEGGVVHKITTVLSSLP